MKEKIKKYIKRVMMYLGRAYMFVFTMAFTYVFLGAYQNPEKKFTVYIDVFGEADMELVFVLFGVYCVSYLFVVLLYKAKELKLYEKQSNNKD